MTEIPSDTFLPEDIPEQFNIAGHFVDAPAARNPHKAAIVGEPWPVTYAELSSLTNRVGNALLELGVSSGDRVLIMLPDSAEFIASFFGAAKIGAVAVPVNPYARSVDYIHYIRDSEPHAAIVHSEALEAFLPASSERAQMPIVIVTEGRVETHGVSCAIWDEWIASASAALGPAETSSNDAAFMLYTSGSGGTPKGAIHRHGDMRVTTRGYAQGVLGLRSDDVTFSTSKLFFAYGLGNGMYFPLAFGASTLLNPKRPTAAQVIEMVSQHRPTIFFSVPTFYAALLREAETASHRLDFSSVRQCVSAGETLPAEIFDRWKRATGLEILDGIGSTEMLHMFISSRPGQCKPGSCGFPVPSYDAKIVDDAGAETPEGEIGSLWVRGASALAEYWRIPELTARTKRGHWVVTGDKFLRDADGYYRYCGRADDMLKVAGMWVSPMEVENALLGHPNVAEAAVVGATDARGLTYAVAHVTLRAGCEESSELAEEIRSHVKARLVSHKVPREIRFCGELPKTVTGKIQRFKLRANSTRA
ncbi:MAG TPA: benzoate-CoA ligase family protein [Candidatus Bathyarchaeia archaeon]|jgi:benzoate-CoA ligase|nr:benzoate-CoA ligase family protein [Candidatus Bathyarchaeia archaeon]